MASRDRIEKCSKLRASTEPRRCALLRYKVAKKRFGLSPRPFFLFIPSLTRNHHQSRCDVDEYPLIATGSSHRLSIPTRDFITSSELHFIPRAHLCIFHYFIFFAEAWNSFLYVTGCKGFDKKSRYRYVKKDFKTATEITVRMVRKCVSISKELKRRLVELDCDNHRLNSISRFGLSSLCWK